MNNFGISVIILTVVFGIFFGYSWYSKTYRPKTLTEAALRPDILLGNTKQYAKDHSYERSLIQIQSAIDAIRGIQDDVDESSRQNLDRSITDLEKVRLEMENDTLIMEDLNYAFSKALNILTIAELRVSEALLESDESNDALVALKYGMYHLKNALRFTAGEKSQYEAHIYDEIDSLLEHPEMDHDDMIERLEYMIAELDSLVNDEI